MSFMCIVLQHKVGV